MTNLVQLISEQYFVQLTGVSKNIDITTNLQPTILRAQMLYIRPLLCPELYDAILLAVTTNTLSPNQLYLLNNYIQPTLAWYTHYELVLENYKIRDAGLVEQISQTYNNTDIRKIEYYRQEKSLKTADTLAIQTRDYLDQNSNLFPGCDCRERKNQIYNSYVSVI
jgi:hypothetical protein